MGRFENVTVDVSGVLQAHIRPAWAAASCFEDTDSYIPEAFLADDNRPVARRRVVTLGVGRLHEELTFLDNDHHSMGYKLVSDERNINPFSASFMNYRCVIKLYQVTTSEETFIRLQGSFKTEPEMTGQMIAAWKQIYRNLIEGLKLLLKMRTRAHVTVPPRAVTEGIEPQPGALMIDTRKLFEHPATTTGGPNSLQLQRGGPSNLTATSSSSSSTGLHIGEISTHGTHVDGYLGQSPPMPVSQPALPSANPLVKTASPPAPVPRVRGTGAPPGYPQPISREGRGTGSPESVNLVCPMPLHLLSLPFFAN